MTVPRTGATVRAGGATVPLAGATDQPSRAIMRPTGETRARLAWRVLSAEIAAAAASVRTGPAAAIGEVARDIDRPARAARDRAGDLGTSTVGAASGTIGARPGKTGIVSRVPSETGRRPSVHSAARGRIGPPASVPGEVRGRSDRSVARGANGPSVGPGRNGRDVAHLRGGRDRARGRNVPSVAPGRSDRTAGGPIAGRGRIARPLAASSPSPIVRTRRRRIWSEKGKS